MSRHAVASEYAWSEYPGLRPGRLYAGKPDLFKRPAGDVHLLADPDATETVCGADRAAFPHDFPDADGVPWAPTARPCTACGATGGAPPR